MPTPKNVMPMAKLPTESVGKPAMKAPVVQPPPSNAPKMMRKPPANTAAARDFMPEGNAASHNGVTGTFRKLPETNALAACTREDADDHRRAPGRGVVEDRNAV